MRLLRFNDILLTRSSQTTPRISDHPQVEQVPAAKSLSRGRAGVTHFIKKQETKLKNSYRPGPAFKLGSPYGRRTDPKTYVPGQFHSGQDFPAAVGTPVPTAASGVVVYSGFNDKLGNVAIVKNDTGDYSLYGHLRDGDRAKLGQRIWPGDTIGLVGNTGKRTTGPHLHYSIISRGARDSVENPGLSHDGGPIGVALNRRSMTTTTPRRATSTNRSVPPTSYLVALQLQLPAFPRLTHRLSPCLVLSVNQYPVPLPHPSPRALADGVRSHFPTRRLLLMTPPTLSTASVTGN